MGREEEAGKREAAQRDCQGQAEVSRDTALIAFVGQKKWVWELKGGAHSSTEVWEGDILDHQVVAPFFSCREHSETELRWHLDAGSTGADRQETGRSCRESGRPGRESGSGGRYESLCTKSLHFGADFEISEASGGRRRKGTEGGADGRGREGGMSDFG